MLQGKIALNKQFWLQWYIGEKKQKKIWRISIPVHTRFKQYLTGFLYMQARPLLKERNYPDLIDERIMDSHDVHQLFWMVRVAEKCLSKDTDTRLTMDNVSLHESSLKNVGLKTTAALRIRIHFKFRMLESPNFSLSSACIASSI